MGSGDRRENRISEGDVKEGKWKERNEMEEVIISKPLLYDSVFHETVSKSLEKGTVGHGSDSLKVIIKRGRWKKKRFFQRLF